MKTTYPTIMQKLERKRVPVKPELVASAAPQDDFDTSTLFSELPKTEAATAASTFAISMVRNTTKQDLKVGEILSLIENEKNPGKPSFLKVMFNIKRVIDIIYEIVLIIKERKQLQSDYGF
jgi:hypothetical protein